MNLSCYDSYLSKSSHPELVSGPILPLIRSKRRQAQPHRQIRPMRVALVDEIDLPLPMPVLELLFTHDCRFHLAKQLEVDEAVHSVTRCEPRERIITMLPHSRNKVGRHANVKRSVMSARKDIRAGLAFLLHGEELGAKWALKQVQGDEVGLILDVSRHADLVSAAIVSLDARLAETTCCCLDGG